MQPRRLAASNVHPMTMTAHPAHTPPTPHPIPPSLASAWPISARPILARQISARCAPRPGTPNWLMPLPA